MSRYQPIKQTASNEGFMDALRSGGNWLSKVGASMKRNYALGKISFVAGIAPEVSGISMKNYQMMIATVKTQMATGNAWDLMVNIEDDSFPTLGAPVRQEDGTVLYRPGYDVPVHKAIVLIGHGNEALVRLPAYEDDSDSRSSVLSYIVTDLGHLTIKYVY